MSKLNPNPKPVPNRTGPRKEEHDTEQQQPDGIVSLDPNNPITPQPLIADILRTEYCVPGSVFLVESIERNIPISELLVPSEDGHDTGRNRRDHHHRHRRPMMRAVRLLLGDGELCVQAFCRGEIHRFVDSGSVFEGGYVRLDRFDVRFVEVDVLGVSEGGENNLKGVVDDGVGDPEWLEKEREMERVGQEMGDGRGKSEKERVVYLVVEDMVTVGWNEVYMDILRREQAEMKQVEEKGSVGMEEEMVIEGEQDIAQADDFDGEDDEEVLQQLLGDDSASAAALEPKPIPKVQSINNLQGQPAQPPPNNDPEDSDHLSDSDSAFETLTISAERANQRRVPVTTPDPTQELQAAIIKQNQQHQQQRPKPIITRPRPWLPTSATQPVKLTPLSAIPHLPYRQNWMVNVLAIVVSLSPVEPSHIAPSFRQRTARLADTSTLKQVHLTVYLDPEDFLPEVGSVVLLLGVKNHLFEGGSLRKYVSDGLVGGGRWWVHRVDELGWCREEVGRLRGWWEAEGRGWGVDNPPSP